MLNQSPDEKVIWALAYGAAMFGMIVARGRDPTFDTEITLCDRYAKRIADRVTETLKEKFDE